MTLHIRLYPEAHNGETVDPQAQSKSFSERVQSVYELAFLQYEDQLRTEGVNLNLLAPGTAPVGYPSIKAILVAEEAEQEIGIDFDLYALLLESYILDGWEGGIARLQLALTQKASDDMVRAFDEKPPGGVYANPDRIWVVARRFFEFTRNLVAMLVHESLVAIEHKAAQIVEPRLTKTLERIAQARAGKLMRRSESGPFELKSRQVAWRLHEDMTTLFMWMGILKKALQDLEDRRRYELGRSREPSGSEAAEGGTGTTDPLKAAEDIKLAESVLQHAQNGATAATKVAHATSPLALLALAHLDKEFTIAEMEEAIGQALTEAESKCKALQEAVNPDTSRIAAKWPRPQLDDPATPDQITMIREWRTPEGGLAAAAATEVLSQMGSDAGWLPLAHEEVLHTLVNEGGIEKESFEYPVYFHYVSAWTEAVDKARETTEAVTGVMSSISRTLAAISLATRAFPQLLPVSGTARAASFSINAFLLAYSLFSYLKGLSALDQAIQLELIGRDALGAESATKIAELEETKDSASDEFIKQMLILLLSMAGARVSVRLQQLVIARDFFLDLETLLLPTDNVSG